MIFLDFLPSTIVGFVAVGLAAVFWSADPQSPTTRALALAFVALAGPQNLDPRAGLSLKGFAGATAHYAVSPEST